MLMGKRVGLIKDIQTGTYRS